MVVLDFSVVIFVVVMSLEDFFFVALPIFFEIFEGLQLRVKAEGRRDRAPSIIVGVRGKREGFCDALARQGYPRSEPQGCGELLPPPFSTAEEFSQILSKDREI